MAVRKRENGSITGSKRYKEEKTVSSTGAKAKALAEGAGVALTQVGQVAQTVSNAASTVTSTAAKVGQAVKDTGQAIGNATGFTGSKASSQLTTSNGDAYGGVSVPVTDIQSLIPSDLLHPQITLKATEEELTTGLIEYAAGTRAQQLLQAGYKYIEEVGKTKQSMHKAQSSIIKGATEEVKVNQNIVEFDIQNVELAIKGEKLNQSEERLKQEQIKTSAAQNETLQLIEKTEALEGKRNAETQRIKAQTNDIIQKYLKDSIQGGV